MTGKTRFGFVVVATSLLASPALAEGPYQVRGSATLAVEGRDIRSPEDDENVSGFFDQYEFTRNKDNGFPVEIGVTDLQLDVLGASETPVMLMRLRSPTSNLSVSGDGLPIDQTFLNQRGELLARPEGAAIDIDYQRLRTDELRLFPTPSGVGTGLGSVFNDDTGSSDRYFVQRTGIGGELRLRPSGSHTGSSDGWAGLISELAVRTGYQERQGQRQLRYMFGGGDRSGGGANDFVRWRALTAELDQKVVDAGAGLVLTPGGLFTLAFDFDHQRFRDHAKPTLQTAINAIEPLIRIDTPSGPLSDRSVRTFGFVPDTNRTTGTARLNTRLGAATIHGGFQFSSLNQEGNRTPLERIAGLRGNKVRFYSGNLAADVPVTDVLSVNGFFKWDERRNEIPRDTELYSRTNGTQLDPFLKRVRKIMSGAEVVLGRYASNRVAAGVKGEWTDRRLEFAEQAVPTDDAILPANALIAEDSRVFTAYLRGAAQPARGLRLNGEVGARNAPETGYVRELDNVAYGQIRASYLVPLKRPVTLSAFGRGEMGENTDVDMQGETLGSVNRDFDSDSFAYGLTASGSPCDSVTMFGSFFQHYDAQDFDLVRSTRRRFNEPGAGSPVDFFTDQPLDYRSDVTNVTVGGTLQVTEQSDASLSYSFTRTNSRFLSDNGTSDTIDGVSRIRSDIHSVAVELGHSVRDGLRVAAGYRFDNFRDRTAVASDGGSVVAPFNPSTRQHTVTLSVTLNTDLVK